MEVCVKWSRMLKVINVRMFDTSPPREGYQQVSAQLNRNIAGA
jgi:hypothetical protein